MKKQAFTLVELIVGITISMILMVWVGIFVGGGISNLTQQEKIIDNSSKFKDFENNLTSLFSRIDTSSWFIQTSSWFIAKQYKEFDKWWFAYVWYETLSWVYCQNDSNSPDLDPETEHIFTKNFIPFEEQWEDIFTNSWVILTASWWTSYISYQYEHVVKNSVWNIIVWKWVFWNEFIEWWNWTWVYLNSPTWLASNGWDILFISDTLNNRVLAYDTSNNKIYKLLDKSDWLDEPTGLYYDNAEKALYIANSKAWEILKYSSDISPDKNLFLSFEIDKNINSLKKLEISFYDLISSVTKPDNTSDFSFTWLTTYTDYLTGSSNKLTYWFSDFANNFGTQTWVACSNNYTTFYEDVWDMVREDMTWCNGSTWSLNKYKSNTFQNLNNWDAISISTNIDLAWTWFTNTWSYYVDLKLIWDETFQKYLPIFIVGDWNLLTKDDNVLSVYASGLNYPTWIWKSWTIQSNQFLDWTYGNLSFDSKNDYKLETPISSLDFDYSSQLLNLDLKYYKQYNCYNTEQKVERSFMLKKSFR